MVFLDCNGLSSDKNLLFIYTDDVVFDINLDIHNFAMTQILDLIVTVYICGLIHAFII